MEGLEEYPDYEANVTFFRREVTENITLTRWKLLLESERQDISDELRKLQKSRERSMKNLTKLPLSTSNETNELGVSAAAKIAQDGSTEPEEKAKGLRDGKVTDDIKPDLAEEHQKRVKMLEDEIAAENLKLKPVEMKMSKVETRLQKLQRKWEKLEEERRMDLIGLVGGVDVVALNKETSKPTAAGTPHKDDNFESLPISESSKLFFTCDGSEYVTWEFTHTDPVMDEDPRPREENPAERKLRMIKEQTNSAPV